MNFLPLIFCLISDLSFNVIGGSIPLELGSLEQLEELVLTSNVISGTIPSAFNNMNMIALMDLSSNRLTGCLPTLSSLNSLTYFNVSSNKLRGNLAGLFANHSSSSTLLPALQTVDVSSNLLTGDIPVELFTVPQLTTVSLNENCLCGTIPSAICGLKNLTNVNMAAMTVSENCLLAVPPFLSPILRGLFPKRPMQGTIPACLWAMESLVTLHIPGNGFTGTVGEILPNSKMTVSEFI